MALNDLPPIWNSESLKEDNEKYEAYHESRDIDFPECPHRRVKFNKGRSELRCPCGAAWSGPRLNELYELLTDNG